MQVVEEHTSGIIASHDNNVVIVNVLIMAHIDTEDNRLARVNGCKRPLKECCVLRLGLVSIVPGGGVEVKRLQCTTFGAFGT
jgi:hypothetical protein